MARIHNLGSINLDVVYRVPHITAPGETLISSARTEGLGGKGANMSIAAAAAGAEVRHYGAVGPDGDAALAALAARGVDCAGVRRMEVPTGHAIIQVAADGENAITLFQGANREMPAEVVDDLIAQAERGDWLLLQNETAHVAWAASRARAAGLKVAYAAAPFEAEAAAELMDRVDLLAMNAVEAGQLGAATGRDIADLGAGMVLVTRGAEGAELRHGAQVTRQAAIPAREVVDTTGAGDTYLGVFLGRVALGDDVEAALRLAAAAASLAVEGKGASDAIPTPEAIRERAGSA